ncbi:uncharacterized protein C8Q71DRAFT_477893 [Rhodofomes roseus]|uniref:Uncharacterized protein n=1 Tax=Rhodofomes roseus TaxID=34475 RepID=A0ABQ8KPP2_9APHY|nr:uncharacterized protein C8Q71DRAFT_477893 [Rhodofomes roseus]KAH9840115.1 hypothetical protein C8Q71DRAFT_477893 [Rhodofomes roseus]
MFSLKQFFLAAVLAVTLVQVHAVPTLVERETVELDCGIVEGAEDVAIGMTSDARFDGFLQLTMDTQTLPGAARKRLTRGGMSEAWSQTVSYGTYQDVDWGLIDTRALQSFTCFRRVR